MKAEFRVGDKVYYPKLGKAIFVLEQAQERQIKDGYSVRIGELSVDRQSIFYHNFTHNGHSTKFDPLPSLFHATAESHALLEQLYDIKFEAPPKPKTSQEIIQAMLDDGWSCVPCLVEIIQDDYATVEFNTIKDFIHEISDENTFIGEHDNYTVVEPLDPKTGKIIVDYVDGEVVLED